jgi:hypothetical protein
MAVIAVAVVRRGNDDATPVTTPVAGGFPVTGFGAVAGDGQDDSRAFRKAITAAAAGATTTHPQRVLVPAAGGRAYQIRNIGLRSNVSVEIQGGAVIEPYTAGVEPSASISLFELVAPDATERFLRNVRLVGVPPPGGGSPRWTADLTTSSPVVKVRAVLIRNARHFVVSHMTGRQVDTNRSGRAPSSYAPVIGMIAGKSPAFSPFEDARDGVVSDILSTGSPFGFGAVGMNSGEAIHFSQITSQGGVALRLETNRGSIRDVTARGIHCLNGHAALVISVHDQRGSDGLDVSGVSSRSCESVVSINAGNGGRFTHISVGKVTATAGPDAQLRALAAHSVFGEWTVGPSRYCVQRIGEPVGWDVHIDGVHCVGTFPGG